MNVFFGKRFLVHGFIQRKDLDDKIHYYGGSVIGLVEHKLQPADFIIEGDESHAEELDGFRKAGIHVINEYTVSCWLRQLNFNNDIISKDRLAAYKEINDVELFTKGGRESFHEIRSMAKELEILRAEKANRDLPPSLSEVLEVVPTNRLDHYCEIIDLNTIFLYEIRKIAREAKRARNNLSAQRWDAFVSSPAIRILGSAKIKEDIAKSGYAHFGMEIWSVHSGRLSGSDESIYGRTILNKYADIMIRNNARAETATLTVEYPEGYQKGEPVKGVLKGEELFIEIPELELDAILSSDDDDRQLLFKSSVKSRGINSDVTLVLTRP